MSIRKRVEIQAIRENKCTQTTKKKSSAKISLSKINLV